MGKNLKGRELGKGISQRKDGRYCARYTDHFGKRRAIYSSNLKEIREKLKKETEEDQLGLSPKMDITLDEWCDIWIRTFKNNCRHSTKRDYLNCYASLKKDLGWKKISNLGLTEMQTVLNRMNSDSTRKLCKVILVDMLNYAESEHLIQSHSAKKLQTKFNQKKEKRILTKEETEIFLNAAKKTRYYELFYFALETGMREGELFALQWANVDFSMPCVYVKNTLTYYKELDGEGKYTFSLNPPKTEAGKRTIPLTKKAVSLLIKQRQKNNERRVKGFTYAEGYEDFIFLTNRLGPMRQCDVGRPFTRIREKTGIDGITFHSLRHTFATRAIENGMNPKTLQRILGHSSLAITMDLYCHVTEDTLYKEMKKMDPSVNE